MKWKENDREGFALGCGAKCRTDFKELDNIKVTWDELEKLPEEMSKVMDRVDNPKVADIILVKMPIYKWHLLFASNYPYFISLTKFGESLVHISRFEKFEKICLRRKNEALRNK